MLALDELAPTGAEMRPRLPVMPWTHAEAMSGPPRPSGPRLDGLRAVLAAARAGLPPDVRLDPLSVADDDSFADLLAGERNLPDGFGNRLAKLLR
jgi:hypothetical protein